MRYPIVCDALRRIDPCLFPRVIRRRIVLDQTVRTVNGEMTNQDSKYLGDASAAPPNVILTADHEGAVVEITEGPDVLRERTA